MISGFFFLVLYISCDIICHLKNRVFPIGEGEQVENKIHEKMKKEIFIYHAIEKFSASCGYFMNVNDGFFFENESLT